MPVLSAPVNFQEMIRLLVTLTVDVARRLFRSRLELLVENLALRQQLAVFKQKLSPPRLVPADRIFWICLRHVWQPNPQLCLKLCLTEYPRSTGRLGREYFLRTIEESAKKSQKWAQKCPIPTLASNILRRFPHFWASVENRPSPSQAGEAPSRSAAR